MDRHRQHQRWCDVKVLLDAALDLSAAERQAYLDRQCGHDSELRREVDDYLEIETDVTGFIDKPLLDLLEAPSVEQRQGETLGAYHLDALIARGGMGAVYRASRIDGAFEQIVAVKVLRRGWISAELVHRFQRERQILADLDHPNIARILDGGSTKDGFPYYVMEYVEGVRIDEFCRDQGLTERQRVELFARVCETVHAAHQRLIVHCDLKPSNVLVSAEVRPKLLDFGIAQLIDATDDAEIEGLSATPLGSLGYSSPEQRLGQAITTASDVFSLGAMLCVVLDDGSQKPLPRADQGQTPPEPSNPDLRAIVLKACHSLPERRYPSATALAQDLRLHLEGFPVSARSPSGLYVAGRLLRRHPLGTATALAVVALVSIFVVTLARQLDATTLQRDRASSLKDAYLEFIEAVDPSNGEVGSEAADEALRAALATELSSDPADRALLLDRLGRIYYRFDYLEDGERLLREALAIRRGLPKPDPNEIAQSANNLAVVLIHSGDLEEARSLIEEAHGLQLDQRFIDRLSRIDVLNNVATVYENLGDLETAERLYRRLLDLKADRYGPESPEFALGLNNLGLVLLRRNRLEEASPLLERSLALRRSLYGEDHLTVATSMTNLAFLYSSQGDHRRAVETNRRILDIRRQHFTEDTQSIARAKNSLAFALLGLGTATAHAEAETLLRQAREAHKRRLGPDHQTTLIIERNLAATLVARNQAGAAEELLRPAITLAEGAFPIGHWRLADMSRVLGSALLELGNEAEAVALLTAAYPTIREATGAESRYSKEAERWLAVARTSEVGR